MTTFLENLAKCLDRDSVDESENLHDLPEWDSLSVLSVVAMIDANYSVTLTANDLRNALTARDLWEIVNTRKT
jgi:acyl carrier protein